MQSNELYPQSKNYFGWDGFCLSSKDIELGVTPAIGGRIISLQFQGKELFFTNSDRLGETFVFDPAKNPAAEKRKIGFGLWGGDKTWVAPENLWLEGIAPIDLDAGQYSFELEPNAIKMTSPVDREIGLQIVRHVMLSENDAIHLKQTFINKGDKKIKRGIWDVTQLLRPFDLYWPVHQKDVMPDKRFLASTKEKDILLIEEGEWVKIHCQQPLEFKYGAIIHPGLVVALREEGDSTLAMVRKFNAEEHANYPHRANVEVYNSGGYNYFECEVLGPLVELEPGDQTSHTQTWKLGKLSGRVTPIEAIEALL